MAGLRPAMSWRAAGLRCCLSDAVIALKQEALCHCLVLAPSYRASLACSFAGCAHAPCRVPPGVVGARGALACGAGAGLVGRTIQRADGRCGTVRHRRGAEPCEGDSGRSAIGGSLPGVDVRRAPGGGFSIRIRGVTTLLGYKEPLYVVDGILVEVEPGRGVVLYWCYADQIHSTVNPCSRNQSSTSRSLSNWGISTSSPTRCRAASSSSS